jgi:hypothetical protein
MTFLDFTGTTVEELRGFDGLNLLIHPTSERGDQRVASL